MSKSEQLKLGFFPDDSEEDGYEDDGYESIFLKDFEDKTFEGEVAIGDLRESEYGEVAFLRISDHDEEKRLIIPLNVKITEDDDGEEIIKAYQNSVLYDFIDSLYEQVNGTERNKVPRYKMYREDFDELEDAINETFDTMKIKRLTREYEDKKKVKHEFKSFEVKKVTML
jgi:hypothetical protein